MKLKAIALTAMSVCAISAFIVAGASAQSFHASKTGNLKGKATSNQVFTTAAGKVTCEEATTTGTVTALLSLHQLVDVIYGKCTAFGLGGVDVSLALYLFNADGGLAKLENTVTITSLIAGCTIVVLGGQDLRTVKYKNVGKNLVEESEVAGIVSHGSGGLCGSGTSTTGTYVGNNEIELVGGEVSWS